MATKLHAELNQMKQNQMDNICLFQQQGEIIDKLFQTINHFNMDDMKKMRSC